MVTGLQISSALLFFSSTEKKRFITTWGWAKNGRIKFFGWAIPLLKSLDASLVKLKAVYNPVQPM